MNVDTSNIKIEVNLDDVLSEDEKRDVIKAWAKDEFARLLHSARQFGWNGDTVLSNMCYDIVKGIVAEMWDGDFDTFVKNKVKALIEKMSSIVVFGSEYDRQTNRHKTYRAVGIVDDAVKEYEPLLRERVKKQIEEFTFDITSEYDLATIIADSLTEVITGRKKSEWKHSWEAAK